MSLAALQVRGGAESQMSERARRWCSRGSNSFDSARTHNTFPLPPQQKKDLFELSDEQLSSEDRQALVDAVKVFRLFDTNDDGACAAVWAPAGLPCPAAECHPSLPHNTQELYPTVSFAARCARCAAAK